MRCAGSFFQELHGEIGQNRRHLQVQVIGRRRAGVRQRSQDADGCFAGKGQGTRTHGVEHTAQAEEVAAMINRLATGPVPAP